MGKHKPEKMAVSSPKTVIFQWGIALSVQILHLCKHILPHLWALTANPDLTHASERPGGPPALKVMGVGLHFEQKQAIYDHVYCVLYV